MKGNENVDNTKELKHLSLCTGYGGIDLGLKRALTAVRTVCYVEIESYAIQNLVTKIEAGHLDAAPIWSNLKTFPWELFNGKVDLLSGGFPCQPFSAAGRRKGSDDPRHLWPHIKDGIKRLGKPTIIFLENVEGIISSKLKGNEWDDPEGTPVLLHVLRELERMDYKATAGVFSASEVGAPHQRKRVFILGIRNGLKQSGYDYVNGLVQSSETTGPRTAWPASRKQSQRLWEPPRVTKSELGEPSSKGPQGSTRPSKKNGGSRLTSANEKQWKILEPKVGRNANGASGRLDYEKLYESGDSRTDELRLLGNGVVPDTATRAFRVTKGELDNTLNKKLQGCAEQSSNEIEPKVGRNANGASGRLDYEKLYESGDSRTDELRLLGNGVVPHTATRAFRTLWRELADTASKPTGGHSGSL